MEIPNLNEQIAWSKIAAAADQPMEYYRWCRKVLEAYKAGQITLVVAASMMCKPADSTNLRQLEQSADAQIVLDYATDMRDGARYIGLEVDLDRDWKYIAEVVQRHV